MSYKNFNQSLIIFILDTTDHRYDAVRSSLVRTWATDIDNYSNIKVILYRGNPLLKSPNFKNNILELPCCDSIRHTSEKFFLAIEWASSNIVESFNIYRTNLSSYLFHSDFYSSYSALIDAGRPFYSGVNSYYPQSRLLKAFLSMPRRSLHNFRDIPFCSGSGFFLSSEYVNLLFEFKKFFCSNIFIDDVSIGYALSSYLGSTLLLTPQSRYDLFDDYSSGFHTKKSPQCSPDDNCFHARIKGTNRFKDAGIFYLMSNFTKLIDLHKFLNNESLL